MDELGFYDGPLGDLWADTPRSLDLKKTRQVLYDRMIELLERQLKKGGSSLYADIDRLALTRGCKLIPSLLEHRSKEMEDIVIYTEGYFADISPLWLTSYGHAVLKSLGVDSTTVTRDLLARIREELGKAGINVKTNNQESEVYSASETPRSSVETLNYVMNTRENWTVESIEHVSPTRVKVIPALTPAVGETNP
ncbi:MAG: hypothetical protein ACFFB7_04155 [Candidatus Sifarchaeia archaeon]